MMNERIKELLKQVEEETNEEYQDETRRKRRLYNEILLPKFAELIVAECAALAKSKSERIQSMETDDRGDQAQIHSLAWQFEEFGYEIKKHFGVKE